MHLSDVHVVHTLPVPHFAIRFDVSLARPPVSRVQTRLRKIRQINTEEFRRDILSSNLTHPCDDLDKYVSNYNSVLSEVLDKHAPLITRCVIQRPNSPWYNETLHSLKHEKRAAERKWKKTGLTVHKQILHEKCKAYKEELIASKRAYWYHQDVINNSDQKQLFRVIDRLSVHKPEQVLPSHSSKDQLVQQFAEYFDNKIKILHQELDAKQLNLGADGSLVSESCCSSFTNFCSMTESEVLEIIRGLKVKSCSLDPLPACLTADNLDLLLPHITKIINMSLETGVFSSALKSAFVTPILKKPNLDPEIMKNYRPISNLAFLGKVNEQCAMNQFVQYLDSYNLFASSQSAYRQFHSIETALTRVYNDILMDLDKQGGEIILVLDLSTAFDTIDHTVFINRLKSRYGVEAPLSLGFHPTCKIKVRVSLLMMFHLNLLR